MSSTIVHLGEQCVHVLTDTAGLTVSGKVGGFVTKLFPVPHANLVVACRGHVGVLPIAAMVLQQHAGSTFDEILENAERVLKSTFMDQRDPALVSAVQSVGASHDAQVVLAGISERKGPCAKMMCISDEAGALRWAAEEIEGEDAMFAEFTDEIETEFERRADAVPGGRIGQLGWLIDRIRHCKAPIFGCGDDIAQIGGHAVLTKITAGAMETRILRVWPDRIGERINP